MNNKILKNELFDQKIFFLTMLEFSKKKKRNLNWQYFSAKKAEQQEGD